MVWEIVSRTGISPDDPMFLIAVELGLVQATISDLPQRLDAREQTLVNLITVLDSQTSQVQAAADAVAVNTRALSDRLDRLVKTTLPKASQVSTVPMVQRVGEWGLAFLVGVLLAPVVIGISHKALCSVLPESCPVEVAE